MNALALSRAYAQRGASLLVVLILLLIMTLLGLAILRGTSLEERMSANLRDRGLGFQAAEAALREGESLASKQPLGTPAPTAGCSAGVCATPVATDADRWLDSGFGGWLAATKSMSLAAPASYFVEYMGLAPTWPGCDRKVPVDALCLAPRYRITAKSEADDRAQVILQTNYIVQ